MAQLSGLAQLYLKISDNLIEEDVRNLRSLLAVDEILGKGKTEKATPLEIFNMLVDNDTIGKGNLGLLVQVLRCLGKGKLAEEAERLEKEHKKDLQGRKIHDTTVMTPESNTPEDARRIPEEDDSAATVTRDRTSEDSGPENTKVKEIISAASAEPEPPKGVHGETFELASLHIRELVRLISEPMKALGQREPDSSTDVQDAKSRLETLLAELDTPAVMADKEQQCVLYCQIGDLYRAKLYDLQSALQYYHRMLEWSLVENSKQAKAHNRLGLTYDMLGKHEEATRSHERVLEICRDVVGDDVDICVAYKNLGTSFTLSGKVSDAKPNYKTALRLARKTGNKMEEMDIHCRLGDLNKKQLNEPPVYYKNYTNMLDLAMELRSKYWKMIAYDRLGMACNDSGDKEEALKWYQKALEMSNKSGDTRDHIITRMNVGALLGKAHEAKFHLDTALQMAQQKGEEYGQMSVYMRMGDMQREKFNSPCTAVQYYEQYLALARQLGDRHEEGWAYNRLGQAYVDIREYETALEWYQKHLTISQEIEDKKEEVTAQTDVGNAYRLLGNMEQATTHFDTALQLAKQTDNLHGQMEVYCKMGEMQKEQLHSPRTAIQCHEQHLALARQLGNSIKTAVAYESMGLAYYEMGEYGEALGWHQKQLTISEDNGDNRQLIRAHKNIGCTYRLLGKLDLASSHHSTALQIAQQIGDQHEQMDFYCKMGDLQRGQLHSPRTAIQYYEQALALARQLGDRRHEEWAYNRLGLAHIDMREYKTALEWYQKALTISQESGDKKKEVTALAAVGNAYRLLGNIEQATTRFDKALQIAQQTENLHGQMDVYCKMGDLQREQLQSPHEANQYYEQYLALARHLGNRHDEGWAYNRLGDAYVDMRVYETSLAWYQKHLTISREIGNKKEEVTVLADVGNAYRLQGNIQQATTHFDTALQLAQQTNNQHGQMVVYCMMGNLQRVPLQSPRTSIQYYEKALELARQLKDVEIQGVAYSSLGHEHYGMGEHHVALEWYQKCLEVFQECGNKTQQILVHRWIAASYKAQCKLDLTRSHYQSALDIAMETGNKQEQMDIYSRLGELHRKQLHEPQKSTKYYTQMLALAKELGDKDKERRAYNRLGLACDAMQDIEAALEWHRKNLEMSRKDENQTEPLTAHKNIGSFYQSRGKLEQARSHYQSALTIAIETGNKQEQKDINKKLASL